MPSDDHWTNKKHRWITAGFAFVGGFADVVCLLKYKAFATMCTGNTIMLAATFFPGSRFSKGRHHWYFYPAVITCFFLGVVLFRLAELRYPNRGAVAVGIPLAIVNVAVDLIFGFLDPYNKWPIAFIAPLFGVVCSASATGRLGTSTTMVTGHILSLGNFLASALSGKSTDSAGRLKITQSLNVLFFTIVGAAAGVGIMVPYGKDNTKGAMTFVGASLVVLFWCHDHLAKPQSLVKHLSAWQRQRAESESDALEEGLDGEDESASGDNDSDVSSLHKAGD